MDLGQVLEQLLSNPVYLGGGMTVSLAVIIGFIIKILKGRGVNINLGQGLSDLGGIVTKVNTRIDSIQGVVNQGLTSVSNQVENMASGLMAIILSLKVVVVSLDIKAEDKASIVAILDSVKLDTSAMKSAIAQVQELVNAKIDEAQSLVPTQLASIQQELDKIEIK